MATPRRRPQKATAGKNYTNRSDLRQAPRAASGQEYGMAKQQMDAQRAIPLTKGFQAPAPGTSPPQAAGPGGGGMGVVPLTAPSTRPNEPLTAGINGGPGPGPEALNMPQNLSEDQNMLAWLQAAYQAFPNDDIARLMAQIDARQPAVNLPQSNLSLPKPKQQPGGMDMAGRAGSFLSQFGPGGSSVSPAAVEG